MIVIHLFYFASRVALIGTPDSHVTATPFSGDAGINVFTRVSRCFSSGRIGPGLWLGGLLVVASAPRRPSPCSLLCLYLPSFLLPFPSFLLFPSIPIACLLFRWVTGWRRFPCVFGLPALAVDGSLSLYIAWT